VALRRQAGCGAHDAETLFQQGIATMTLILPTPNSICGRNDAAAAFMSWRLR